MTDRAVSPAKTDSSRPPEFEPQLGLFDATMLVTGTMIGSGIFIVSAGMSRELGSPGWLMVVWALTGLMTIFGALSYAELAAMMPHAGGQYVYLREAYGPLWGFLYGWTSFLVIQTGTIAAVAVAFSKFLGVIVPSLGAQNILYESQSLHLAIYLPGLAAPIFERTKFTISAGQLVGVGVIVLLTWLNCRGVRYGKHVQNSFALAKSVALAGLIVVGLTFAASSQAISANTADVWGGISATPQFTNAAALVGGSGWLAMLMVAGGAMVGSLFSADAWNNVTYSAGEVRNPRRNLPLALIAGVSFVTLLYMLCNLAYLCSLPLWGEAGAETVFGRGISHARDDRVGTAVLELVSPSLGAPLMSVAIMASTFGCANGLVLMGPRLYYAMARDGLFFASVGKLSRQGVPAVALILQGVWSCVLVFSGTYNELLDYVIFAALLFYALTVAALFVLRRTRPDAERPYRTLGYPIVPALYLVLCLLLMADLLIVKPVFTWPGLILVLMGIPVYFGWRKLASGGGLREA